MTSKTPLLIGAIALLGLGTPDKVSAAGGPVTLNGSGSTLSKPYQETAIEEFKQGNKTVTINYGGGGSGKGRQDLADMVVDFAGSPQRFGLSKSLDPSVPPIGGRIGNSCAT